MRVLLLNPPAVGGVRFVREGRCGQRLTSFHYNMLPISLLSTASLLRVKGHRVHLTEATARQLSAGEVVGEVVSFSPELVLVNVTTVSFRGDAAMAALLKEKIPGAFIAAYGIHVTALPEESLDESCFDGVIRREPESTAAELAEALEKNTPLETVAGISFRANRPRRGERGAIVHNPDRPFLTDLDSLPVPARDLVDHRHYPAPVSRRPHTLLSTSRGCPHACTFCAARLYYGSRLRLRSPESVGEEIESVCRETGLDLFTFWSDTFTLDRDHVIGICRQIQMRKLSIDWMCNSRVDSLDPEMLSLMAASGCRIISFGVESGSQRILDNARKGITTGQAEEAFRRCRQAGVKTAAHFIMGLPGETPGTIRESLRLVRRMRPDYVQFYGAIPLPGTAFYRQAKKEGWITARDWDDFEINREIVSTPTLTSRQLGRWRRRAFLGFYFRPSYLAARLVEVRRPADLGRLAETAWGFIRHWVLSTGRR